MWDILGLVTGACVSSAIVRFGNESAWPGQGKVLALVVFGGSVGVFVSRVGFKTNEDWLLAFGIGGILGLLAASFFGFGV